MSLAKPPTALVEAVKASFHSRNLDSRFLIPILSSLTKPEILGYLPKLVKLPRKAFEQAVLKLMSATPLPLTPSELLVALHLMDTAKSNVTIFELKEATQACLDQKLIFKQDILAAALQRLIDQMPLPVLFMRTVLCFILPPSVLTNNLLLQVIQSVSLYPGLVGFVNSNLTRLLAKKIWEDASQWDGFARYCDVSSSRYLPLAILRSLLQLVKPHSFGVLLQLPRPQLLDVLDRSASLKERFTEYLQKNAGLHRGKYQQLLQLIEPKPALPETSAEA